MIPSPDFFAFVPSVFAHQTMDEITHDSGMTLPSTGRNTRIAVPVQISIPILSWCALGQAHQLSAVVANDDPGFTFQIDDFVYTLALLGSGFNVIDVSPGDLFRLRAVDDHALGAFIVFLLNGCDRDMPTLLDPCSAFRGHVLVR